MRTDHDTRELHSEGIQAKRKFAISQRNVAFILELLRSSIYSDKVKAVIREYSSNAMDAHAVLGKKNLPIKVVLPTSLEPTLSIRDFGPGMSEEEIFEVLTQYGESTKRGDDDQTGMLGIGAKSGFAYGDSFTVISWNGGTKKIYFAVLDETEEGEIQLMDESPCGDETGTEIQIPVRAQDIREFERKAQSIYTYYDPQPEINTTLAKPERYIKDLGFFHNQDDNCWSRDDRGNWVALMGNVPYRIDLDQIDSELAEAAVSKETLERTGGGLKFPIGGIQFAASREELKYTPKTRKALAEKFAALIDAFIEESLETLRGTTKTEWEKRLHTLKLVSHLKIRIPTKYSEYSLKEVLLGTKVTAPEGKNDYVYPKTFTMVYQKTAVHQVNISINTRLVLKDDPRPLEGFNLEHWDHLIRPVHGVPLEEVEKELETYLKDHLLTGIPSVRLTTMNWSQFRNNQHAPKTPNIKHRVSTFRLREDKGSFGYPWSNNWHIETREPTEEDVYVIINQFQAVECDHFYDLYLKDKEAAAFFKVDMPPIYGYKTTAKEPVKNEDLLGTEYQEWREGFFLSLLTPERVDQAQKLRWSNIISEDNHVYWDLRHNISQVIEQLKTKLGETHSLVNFLEHYKQARTTNKLGTQARDAMGYLLKQTGKQTDIQYEAELAQQALYKIYPLLKLDEGLGKLADGDSEQWINYLQLVDSYRKLADLHSVQSSTAQEEDPNIDQELVV